METHAFGFRLRANAPEGQKRFPISIIRNHLDPSSINALDAPAPRMVVRALPLIPNHRQH